MLEKVIPGTSLKLLKKSTEQLAGQHLRHAELCAADPMVCHAVVFEIVSANFLGTISAADLSKWSRW